MASIKAIQQKTVHQIQSGQVIVDLNSVVKELVENSVDAGSTSIEVRFRNHGLDAIEVVDNGSGISPSDYSSVALKHHTSKLSTYDDLESLKTFGFRGEALASLCALSQVHIITARDVDAPRGRKLEFDMSGKLKNSSIVAAQKGTKVVVERLFYNLPVRKKELEKNIKREYAKVLNLLQAYACISTGVRFVVSNQMPKAGKNVAFATGVNSNTKDNITNVFGAKTLHALVKLDLTLAMQSSTPGLATQTSSVTHMQSNSASQAVTVQGHISRPVFGEGRQAPDRQFFFVNSRPCGLPQVAKAFNEVYKSFNISQSPFIFANIIMDTRAYDVNVSPDKRTILLHDQNELLESLKAALLQLFEAQEQSVPQSKVAAVSQAKLPDYKPLAMTRQTELDDSNPESSNIEAVPSPFDHAGSGGNTSNNSERGASGQLIHNWIGRDTVDRGEVTEPRPKQQQQQHYSHARVQNAFDRMRPPRTPLQVAEITIGSKTTSTVIGSGSPAFKRRRIHMPNVSAQTAGLRAFAMPGSQSDMEDAEDEEEEEGGQDDDGEVDEDSQEDMEGENGGSDEEFDQNTDGLQYSTAGEVDASQSIPVQQQANPPPVSQPFFEESTDEGEGEDGDIAEGAHADSRGDEVETTTAAGDSWSADADGEYLDESQRRSRDDERVAQLIHKAEEAAARPSTDNLKRANHAIKSTAESKHSVLTLVKPIDACINDIKQQASVQPDISVAGLGDKRADQDGEHAMLSSDVDKAGAEAQLSLIVSKADFADMLIAGQFNLGFIIALRRDNGSGDDDLFIIDQHAADEKYNFERFTSGLKLEAQRLAQPKQLYLTAVEEEILLEHSEALAANGFVIESDTSGTSTVGERCKLVCLPMSKDTTFDLSDLEELLHLLSDQPSNSSSGLSLVRPTKVRKMLAMRACRSSIMVGKTLTAGQMQRVVRNLGEMDKPWNCPHGRPTMRHLTGLSGWQGWDEADEYEMDDGSMGGGRRTDWKGWVRKRREASEDSDDE